MAEEHHNKDISPEQPGTDIEETTNQQAVQPTGEGQPENDLQQKLEAAQRLADTYKDQLLRKAAEFDNYKKRTEAEFANLGRIMNEGIISSLIPILDDFARSLKSGREIKEHESFFKGVELIYAKFLKLLESHGLTPFDSVGQPFNVELHDAMLQIPRSDVPPHTVIEEIERGYKLYDRVIRHAKVIVSAEAPSAANPSNGEAQGVDPA